MTCSADTSIWKGDKHPEHSRASQRVSGVREGLRASGEKYCFFEFAIFACEARVVTQSLHRSSGTGGPERSASGFRVHAGRTDGVVAGYRDVSISTRSAGW